MAHRHRHLLLAAIALACLIATPSTAKAAEMTGSTVGEGSSEAQVAPSAEPDSSECVVAQEAPADPSDEDASIETPAIEEEEEPAISSMPPATGFAEECHGKISRLEGANASFTMRAIVRESFKRSDAVVIATGANFKDALAASALAGYYDAPIILTARDRLTQVAANEVSRLKATRAYIVGGTSALSTQVGRDLQAMGLTVKRVWGETSMGTSRAVAERIGRADTAIVATSRDFADALSIAPWAYANKAPIVLTDQSGKISAMSISSIRKLRPSRIVIVGGEDAVSADSEARLAATGIAVERIAGVKATDTSRLIAKWELRNGFSLANVAVATRYGYKDALSGASLMGMLRGPILLANGQGGTAVKNILTDKCQVCSKCFILGGDAAVSLAVEEYLCDAFCSAIPVWRSTSGRWVFAGDPADAKWVVDQAAWDEWVVDQAAWDETVVDQAAWDEPIYETQQVSVGAEPVYEERSYYRMSDGAIFYNSEEARSYREQKALAGEGVTASVEYETVQVGTREIYESRQVQTGTVHHDAVTHVVHHDEVGHWVHHDEVGHWENIGEDTAVYWQEGETGWFWEH